MDPAGLRRIAERTGGAFRAAADGERSLVGLYEDEIRPMARKAFAAAEDRAPARRFQWFLLPAFVLWLLGPLLGVSRRRT
jgi:hypothetical protein